MKDKVVKSKPKKRFRRKIRLLWDNSLFNSAIGMYKGMVKFFKIFD